MDKVARQDERPAAAVSRSSLPAMIGLAGLVTASTALTTLAVSDTPPGLEAGSPSYYLALSGVFYAGVAELGAAVWWMSDPACSRRIAAGRKLLYASLVPLAAAGGLAVVATLF
ncbi:unnamed protein product [Urochloa decumbens]|uniref:Uncharacterized protein n=1 Tax=Urochloa decumbens TaxID=240449 RepID=A0ABC9AI28_9POAL